jgi:uncharacterized coiled-coil protein SlyX
MQWIFMLIGLVLGWVLDESFGDALLGALLGLGIGQAIRIGRLALQATEQQLQLQKAQVDLLALQQRLASLETSGMRTPQAPEPAPEFILDDIPVEAPELVW